MDEALIRPMNAGDLDAVTAIEEATFARPWSRQSFQQELERNVAARYLVAEKNGQVVGYAGAWIILDESHITNIAITEAERGKGIGRKLTEALMQYLLGSGRIASPAAADLDQNGSLNAVDLSLLKQALKAMQETDDLPVTDK